MEITKDILYVGVNDHLVDLFESQYDVPNGMAYNSYLICAGLPGDHDRCLCAGLQHDEGLLRHRLC